MKEVRCVKIKLKPGSLARGREWAAEIGARRKEALATLRDESVVLESFFLNRTDAGDYLIASIRAASLAQAAEAVERSAHELDACHAQFKRDTWASGRQLELLVDLRLDEFESRGD